MGCWSFVSMFDMCIWWIKENGCFVVGVVVVGMGFWEGLFVFVGFCFGGDVDLYFIVYVWYVGVYVEVWVFDCCGGVEVDCWYF